MTNKPTAFEEVRELKAKCGDILIIDGRHHIVTESFKHSGAITFCQEDGKEYWLPVSAISNQETPPQENEK